MTLSSSELQRGEALLSDREYEYFRSVIYDRCRINLGGNKRELVKARLAKRLRTLNFRSFRDYIDFLQTPRGEEEWTHLIDSISTNYTFFFREPAHFDFLYNTALPERAQGGFRVWSAACSSGEEPYSIAVVLNEYFGKRPGAFKIECTDISTRILTRAQEGLFPPAAVEKIRPDWLKRYFEKGRRGTEALYRVRPELRQDMTFRHLNLMSPTFPWREMFDVIFCRNVMIYFDRETQQDLVGRMVRHLAPGGYLIIGHSESLTGVKHNLKMLKPSIYKNL